MIVQELALGIDIGGTTTSFGFVDKGGGLVAKTVIDTLSGQPAETLASRIHETVSVIMASLPATAKLKGIGIGAPNANYYNGTVENPPNLKWGPSTPLAALFQGYFNLPVAITNDANAAALGELYFGGARGLKNFIVITLGTGLGSGIVVNGELLYGAGGFAGELGHTVVDPQGRYCGCGKRGCLETYASATGLCRTVFALLAQRREPSRLRDVSYHQLTSRQVYEAAVDGDVIALAAFDETARVLGIKLADAVAHTEPEAIFLSGGLAAAGDLLLEPTQRYLEEYLFSAYRGKVRLRRSELQLQEGTSAVMGAAALLWHELEGK